MVSWGMSTFKEIYVSVDVEANGPIPGPYSLTSIGAFTAGGLTSEGEYVSFDHGDEGNKFYVELAPISPDYNPRAIQVGLLEGFDPSTAAEDGSDHFAWTQEHGVEAGEAMRSFAEWVAGQRVVHGGRPIFMAYPASFDWTFVYWYFQRYGVESPLRLQRRAGSEECLRGEGGGWCWRLGEAAHGEASLPGSPAHAPRLG